MSIPRDTYIGEPGYPTPWATMMPREGLRDLDEARIVSLAPDVCKTPVGSSIVPIPYPVVDFCGHDQNYTSSVRFTGKKSMVMRSRTTHVHGDKAGRALGVKSGTVESISEPVGHSAQVRAEGSHVIRHLDRFKMNSGNTVGEALFVRNMKTYVPPEDTDPVPGSLRWVEGDDNGRVLSDAMPEPVIMGAQYAYTGNTAQVVPAQANASGGVGQAVPRPSPGPAPSPAPRPPGTVITPGPERAPTWHRTPPHRIPVPPVNPGQFARLAVWARRLSPIGILSSVLIPTNGANLSDVVPRDDFERRVSETFYEGVNEGADSWEMRDWAMEEIRRHREANPEIDQRPQALPQADNVRVEQEEEKRRCRIDTYTKMEPICRSMGMQAHHIVPDWSLRYGTRVEARAGLKRIPNMPGFWEGQSMCVVGQARVGGTEHNTAHMADATIEALGANSNPPNTATLDSVKNASIVAMVGLRPDCAPQIVAAVNGQFAGRDPNQLLRAKQYPPLQQSTLEALQSGAIRGANARP